MPSADPQVAAHLEWLGFVRPTGLVVSAPALVRAGAILDRHDTEGQRLLRECVASAELSVRELPGHYQGRGEGEPLLPDFETFARRVLGWSLGPKFFTGGSAGRVPEELELALPEAGTILRPEWAVREPDPAPGALPWQLLVQTCDAGTDPDLVTGDGSGLDSSAHGRLERLLRHTGVEAGVLYSGRAVRLISAPRGESSGWLDFRTADMVQTAGRPITSAMRLLLSERRLLALHASQRLPALLADSRKYQNEVSERLAEQVLHALYELLRGMQAAHDASGGRLLAAPLAEDPDDVYRALLTVVLRLVFLLYAEERDMLPADETFARYYSLAGLWKRLREDAALYPDTLDSRYGAWAQLLVLFRMVYNGAQTPAMRLPARHGDLFDPHRFGFLEGRQHEPQPDTYVNSIASPLPAAVPLIPDGTILRALEDLLVLDGERISYRALDVEQIGSVYQTMMGFSLQTAVGPSVAIKAAKRSGAPVAVDLAELAERPSQDRPKAFQDATDRKLSETQRQAVTQASGVDQMHAALHSLIDHAATPDRVPAGSMILQPSDERRRTGSHYTPRSLTQPIVATTLQPHLDRLRAGSSRPPPPAAILDLKVCDMALGSGAFLVETCRQLADALVEGWRAHDQRPAIPAGEDETVFARRQVAQRCLYGVDRNPMAVDLAKMSLWLATLARDHPLTFLDHALRHGDSLVGLDNDHIRAFHWSEKPVWASPFQERMSARLQNVIELRERIRTAGEDDSDAEEMDLWKQADEALQEVRLAGDLAVAAFFGGKTAKERLGLRQAYVSAYNDGATDSLRAEVAGKRQADELVPFHYQIEFPEVFERTNPGFDAVVGNPPFAGKNTVSGSNVAGYPDWLQTKHPQSHGNADLVAHFFRGAFDLLRQGGTLGLIATNTIAQGDTRSSGLRWICNHGGEIYDVRKRVKWPGVAVVVVSVIHIAKGEFAGQRRLDSRPVEKVTAFLFHRGGHDDPARLAANAGQSFVGSYVLGMGFTFDDTDARGIATPIAEMNRLIAANPANQEVIFPYIGGEEVNSSPTHAHHRYVINFGERSEEECRARWPELMAIVEAKVRPERMKNNREVRKRYWWRFGETTPALFAAIAGMPRVLVISQTSRTVAFTFLPTGMVYSHKLVVFPFQTHAAFAALQSQPHELWARFFGSTMKDDAVYTPSDCFETFPFLDSWSTHPRLEEAGRAYYDFRAALMVERNEGLTKTYSCFHDPYESDPDILHLRDLHAAMDRAVLDAYGWEDIDTTCEFIDEFDDGSDAGPEAPDARFRGNTGSSATAGGRGGRSGSKQRLRYRWPDHVRDEVLARLLDLNAARHEEEVRRGVAGRAGAKSNRIATGEAVGSSSDTAGPGSSSTEATTRGLGTGQPPLHD